jgi:NADH dehydrogenase FAD-containing subunit
MRRIVALGSGIGGWYAFRDLTGHLEGRPHIELTFLVEAKHFSYRPLLPAVVSGRFDPADVTLSFASAIEDNECTVDTIETVDRSAQQVVGTEAHYPYDALLIDGAHRTHPPAPSIHTLRDASDAIGLRDALRQRLHKESSTSVAIVGGTATGVELAGHLASAAAEGQLNISIFESKGRLVADLPPEMQVAVRSHLEEAGVAVHTDTHVDPSEVDADTVVWCAGGSLCGFGLTDEVDETLRLRDGAPVFRCGGESVGERKRQGRLAAKNLVASLSGQALSRRDSASELLDGLLWLGSTYLAHRGGTLLEGWAARTIFIGYHASVLPGARAKTRLASNLFSDRPGLLPDE